ncbi:MAG: EamA family transporter [Rhodothermales bacterium]
MTAAQVMRHMGAYRTRFFLAFAAIYLIWGSTFLAIRFAIETIPPILMGGIRFAIAGGVLHLWSRLRGKPRPALNDVKSAAFIGFLMVVIGNGTVIWAEQFVPSGLAAVLVATGPLWLVLLDWWLSGRKPLPSSTIIGLVLGFTGVVALSVQGGDLAPSAEARTMIYLCAVLLTLSTLGWASGSMIARRLEMKTSLTMTLSLQMMLGGAMMLTLGTVAGEWSDLDVASVTITSLASLGYLIVMGTLVAFSAYVWLMRESTPANVGTHGYVNPVVAVFLGWGMAGEPLSVGTLVATATILAGVALINLPGARSAINGWIRSGGRGTPDKPDLTMIARTWHGVVPAEKEDEYLDYLNRTGVTDCRGTKGNQGVYVMHRRDADKTHFLFVSLWDSMDAIKAFAGNEPEKARYYPEDVAYLLELEPCVEHYDVA